VAELSGYRGCSRSPLVGGQDSKSPERRGRRGSERPRRDAPPPIRAKPGREVERRIGLIADLESIYRPGDR